jgi:hypothetical protein
MGRRACGAGVRAGGDLRRVPGPDGLRIVAGELEGNGLRVACMIPALLPARGARSASCVAGATAAALCAQAGRGWRCSAVLLRLLWWICPSLLQGAGVAYAMDAFLLPGLEELMAGKTESGIADINKEYRDRRWADGKAVP